MKNVTIVTETLIEDGVYLKDERTAFANYDQARKFFEQRIAKDRTDAKNNGWTNFEESEECYESWKSNDEYATAHCRIVIEEVPCDETEPMNEYVVTIPYHTFCEVIVKARNEEEAKELAMRTTGNEDELLENLEIPHTDDINVTLIG